MRWQGENEAGDEFPQIRPEIIKALRYLRREQVFVPFARCIWQYFPSFTTISRTIHQRFLDFIKFSAALHQFSRERTESGKLVATNYDYKVALRVLKAITKTKGMIPLTENHRAILDAMQAAGGGWLWANEFIAESGLSDAAFYDNLDALCEYHLVTHRLQYSEEIRRRAGQWKIVSELYDGDVSSLIGLPESINQLKEAPAEENEKTKFGDYDELANWL
jgi:hypothetical protein